MQFAPLTGKQREAVRLSTARENIYEGAVRSSKTICTIMQWLKFTRTGPEGPLLMVGKTERTLKRNVIDPIQEMVGAKRCRYKVGAGEVELLGRTIYVAGAHDETSADKIKGLTLAGAYGDELTTWPESFYDMLGTRFSVPGAQFFGTTNPAAPTHWLMKKYLKRARLHLDRDGVIRTTDDPDALDMHRFSFQLADNPTLTPEYIHNLSTKYTGLFYRRNILGEWVLAEGAVYEDWNPELEAEGGHVVTELPRIDTWLGIGLDYGATNPFSAIAAGIGTGSDGIRRVYLTHEYRYDSASAGRQLAPTEYSQQFRDWMANARLTEGKRGIPAPWIFIDPAADFGNQLFYDKVTNYANADNDVLAGIQTVSGLIASDRLRVHEDCAGFIEEAAGYSWDPKATERGDDKPLKVNDHSLDAARYVLHTTAHTIRRSLDS
jgi:PBSX family phage terminase large subunit